jgi:hypothetical protein
MLCATFLPVSEDLLRDKCPGLGKRARESSGRCSESLDVISALKEVPFRVCGESIAAKRARFF